MPREAALQVWQSSTPTHPDSSGSAHVRTDSRGVPSDDCWRDSLLTYVGATKNYLPHGLRSENLAGGELGELRRHLRLPFQEKPLYLQPANDALLSKPENRHVERAREAGVERAGGRRRFSVRSVACPIVETFEAVLAHTYSRETRAHSLV